MRSLSLSLSLLSLSLSLPLQSLSDRGLSSAGSRSVDLSLLRLERAFHVCSRRERETLNGRLRRLSGLAISHDLVSLALQRNSPETARPFLHSCFLVEGSFSPGSSCPRSLRSALPSQRERELPFFPSVRLIDAGADAVRLSSRRPAFSLFLSIHVPFSCKRTEGLFPPLNPPSDPSSRKVPL